MRFVGGALQTLVMAAIVTTALYLPVGGLVALVCALSGISLQSLLTFGGALGLVAGLLAWWGILLVPALVYSVYAMPWHGSEPSG